VPATVNVVGTHVCYTHDVREKEFINKVHKHLPTSIYRWKINDPYHGGVPDTYYSGNKGNCFIEYKYQEELPKRDTSKLKINLSAQQRIWLTTQHEHNVNVLVVLGTRVGVYTTRDFQLKEITVKEFKDNCISFNNYINKLKEICE